ncbi:MAG: DUF881 domain-containing protein [Patescibacteria group bacterium]
MNFKLSNSKKFTMIPTPRVRERPFALLIVGVLLGAFFIVQARSFEKVTELATRDANSNIFREISSLYQGNHDLEKQINDLEKTLGETKDRSTSLQALEKEILKNRILLGAVHVSGPGISVTLPKETSVAWMIDLANELFSLGSEAVSVNGIRITYSTSGFESLPQQKILFNGNILQPPYIFEAIGEPSLLFKSLLQPSGFLQRFKQILPKSSPIVDRMEHITMQKVASGL